MVSNFTWTVRVYYEDTDTGGIVFYANYLKFFERARTEWLRAAGINQKIMTDLHQVMFVIKTTSLDYHMPAKLDDELKLTVVVERLGRASIEFFQEAWRIHESGLQSHILTSGRIKVACVDTKTLRPTAIPKEIMANIIKRFR